MEEKKVFLIINSYFIGDILLVNPLIQNIKRIYKNSLVVMLTSPQLYDIAKYQQGVDDVIIWDRSGKDKGFFNMIKFILKFPYKKIYASFPIYSTDRPTILAKLLGSKYILGQYRNLISKLQKRKYDIKFSGGKAQKTNMELLSGITQEELTDCPMKFCPPPVTSEAIKNLENKDFIVLSPKSSRVSKDIPNDKVQEIIEKTDKTIVLIGGGEEAQKLSDFLKNKNYDNLINLIGKTNLIESAQVIQLSKGCISADTGMLHMSCALDKATVGVYYEQNLDSYKPNKDIYPKSACLDDDSVENILNTMNNLLN